MEFRVSQSFSLASHGVSLPHVERERESLFVFFAIVHVDPPSSIKLVIVVGGGNNMICSPPLTSLLAGPKVSQTCLLSHTPQQKSVQNKNKSFFCASFGQKCTKETRGVCHTLCDLAIYIFKKLS